VFVQYSREISKPFDRIVDLLPEVLVLLDEMGEDSYREGEELRIRIGPRPQRRMAAKTVSLRADTPIRDQSSIRIPLSWEATGTPGLFPRMTADLILAPLGDQLTQIRFEGSYEPPLGGTGRLLDRIILHRVAEVSVENLVDRIVDVLQAAASTRPPAVRRNEEE